LSDVAVDIQGVSKRFRLYEEKYTSLKERVIHAGRIPFRELWALRDVSFKVTDGETVGILGQNGSGKSTLLKCVCGVLQPTVGQVEVRGKLAGLLELGSGFQQELSGRDNIYLNGSMLGMSRRDVDRVFDDIVEFSELGSFIDNQVKFYSSGMYVRLGFAVAVSVEPDILVVDEVLAVGDERFQRKCLARIKRFQKEGRTIFFVTHAPDLVRQICDRAVLLDQGQVVIEAEAAEAIEAYHQQLVAMGAAVGGASEGKMQLAPDRPVKITSMELEHAGSGTRPYLLPHESMVVRFAYEATAPVHNVVFSYSVFAQSGDLIHACDTAIMNIQNDIAVGSGQVEFHFDEVPLLDGHYIVHVGISGSTGEIYDVMENAAEFSVMNPGQSRGMVALEPRFQARTASYS